MKCLVSISAYRGPLYHATSVYNALSIISKGVMQLASTYEPNEAKHARGKMFYASFTRSRDIEYIRSPVRPVIIEVDSDKLAQRYKLVPVNYFQHTTTDQFSRLDEMEERVLSNKPEIKITATAVHIIRNYVTRSEHVSALRKLVTKLRLLKIQVYVYENLNMFERKRPMDLSQVMRELAGDENSFERKTGKPNPMVRKSVKSLLELLRVLKAPDITQLSDSDFEIFTAAPSLLEDAMHYARESSTVRAYSNKVYRWFAGNGVPTRDAILDYINKVIELRHLRRLKAQRDREEQNWLGPLLSALTTPKDKWSPRTKSLFDGLKEPRLRSVVDNLESLYGRSKSELKQKLRDALKGVAIEDAVRELAAQ